MTCPERCLWYALRDVYRRFQNGEITQDKGDAEKRRAVRQYELDAGVLHSANRIIERNANMWTEIELAAMAYGRDRTVENADAFFRAVYGVKLRNAKEEAAV